METASVGKKQHLETIQLRIRCLKVSMRDRFSRMGGGAVIGGGASRAQASSLVWETIDSAFKSRIATGAVINSRHIEPRHFLRDARRMVQSRVTDAITEHGSIKVNTRLEAEFELNGEKCVKSFGTKNAELVLGSNLRKWYARQVEHPILTSLSEFQERNSGWGLLRILHLAVNMNKYEAFKPGCYIQLPQEIQKKHAVINIKCSDNACFFWSVMASLHPVATPRTQNPSRTSSYPDYTTELDTSGIQLPVTLKQIGIFERNNKISVNVFGWEEETKRCVPLRITEKKRDRHVHLLLIESPRKDAPSRYHYAAINSLSRLVSAQISKKEHARHICER